MAYDAGLARWGLGALEARHSVDCHPEAAKRTKGPKPGPINGPFASLRVTTAHFAEPSLLLPYLRFPILSP